MPWNATEESELNIDCSGPTTTEDSGWIGPLGTKEAVEMHVERHDGGGTNRWFVGVRPSTNKSRDGNYSQFYVMEASQTTIDFTVTDKYSFKIRVGNGEYGGDRTETVGCHAYWRRDGADF